MFSHFIREHTGFLNREHALQCDSSIGVAFVFASARCLSPLRSIIAPASTFIGNAYVLDVHGFLHPTYPPGL